MKCDDFRMWVQGPKWRKRVAVTLIFYLIMVISYGKMGWLEVDKVLQRVLQCVAVCCGVVQCGAVWCSVVQYGAVRCSMVVWCSVLQCGVVCCSVV